MKKLKVSLLVFAAFITTALFSLNAKEKPTWTILIYGHGDHSLSGILAYDLTVLEKVGSSDSFRIVCQADFDASQLKDNTDYGLPEELSTDISRFLITKSDDDSIVRSKPVMRLPERMNMDDPRTLLDFLKWGMKTYPADRYAIIFWDHGGQWTGFGGDSQDGTLDDVGGLLPGQIADILQEVFKQNNLKKVDLIAFDTCLMGGIEVLDSFNGLCDYFIACPEIDYGDGWDYEAVLRWLKAHPDATMAEFGKVEVKAWEKLHMEAGKDNDLYLGAHACYDMSKYPAVRNAFLHFSRKLVSEFSPKNMIFPRMRRLCAQYDGDANPDYIDLGGFAKSFSSADKVSPELKKSADELVRATDSMVIAKALGENKLGASGLSIWYPCLSDKAVAEDQGSEEDGEEEEEGGEEDSEEEEEEGEEGEAHDGEEEKKNLLEQFDQYRKVALFRDCAWADYLKKVFDESDKHEEDQLEMTLAGATKKIAASGSFKVTASVKETPGAFLLHCKLFRPEGKGKTKKFLEYGEVSTVRLNGSGKYSVDWKPQLMHLTGADGKSLPLSAWPMSSNGEFWYSYAELRKPGKKKTSEIRLVIRVESSKASLVSILEDSEKLSPVPVKMKKGFEVIPVYVVTERSGNDPDKWKSWSVPAKKGIAVTEKKLDSLRIDFRSLKPGRYLMDLELENVAGYFSYPMTVHFSVTK